MKKTHALKLTFVLGLLAVLGVLGMVSSAQDTIALPAADAPASVEGTPAEDTPIDDAQGGGGGVPTVTLNGPAQGGAISFTPNNVLSWTWSAQIFDKFILKLKDIQTGEVIRIVAKGQNLACFDNGIGGLYCMFTLQYDHLKLLKDDHAYLWNVTAKATFGAADPVKYKSDSWMFTVELIDTPLLMGPAPNSTTSEAAVMWVTDQPNNIFRVKVKDVKTGTLVFNQTASPFCVKGVAPGNSNDVYMCISYFNGVKLGNKYKVWVMASNQYGTRSSLKNKFTFDIVPNDDVIIAP